MKSFVSLLVAFAFCANLVACGTIIHPERKGQVDGKIDAGIAVLDGLGLLFFLVPGVIAFAVDFSNGTIYLPGGQTSTLSPDELDSIVHDDKLDKDALQHVLKKHAPAVAGSNPQQWQVQALNDPEQLPDLLNPNVSGAAFAKR